jgi:hypothetical protein
MTPEIPRNFKPFTKLGERMRMGGRFLLQEHPEPLQVLLDRLLGEEGGDLIRLDAEALPSVLEVPLNLAKEPLDLSPHW